MNLKKLNGMIIFPALILLNSTIAIAQTPKCEQLNTQMQQLTQDIDSEKISYTNCSAKSLGNEMNCTSLHKEVILLQSKHKKATSNFQNSDCRSNNALTTPHNDHLADQNNVADLPKNPQSHGL
jgi:hypothetical protein